MVKTDSSIAKALSRAHQALLKDLGKLEESVDSASEQDLQALQVRLGATRAHILDHFRFEEQNGYMDKVRNREPRLERTIDQLASEHRHLAQSLAVLIEKAKEAKYVDQALRTEVRDWIAAVQQHESREDELVQGAFNLDIGAED
jgi:hemerythrin